MKARSPMVWSLVAISAVLLVLPANVLADRGPFKELDPPYSLTDPEVPDGRMPPRVAGTRPSLVIGDDSRVATAPRAAVVRQGLLERILRVLRALALGGPVR